MLTATAKKKKKRCSHEYLPFHSSHYAKTKVLYFCDAAKSVAAFHHGPVDDIPQLFEGVGASVLVVEVVCVFPHIEGKQGGES